MNNKDERLEILSINPLTAKSSDGIIVKYFFDHVPCYLYNILQTGDKIYHDDLMDLINENNEEIKL